MGRDFLAKIISTILRFANAHTRHTPIFTGCFFFCDIKVGCIMVVMLKLIVEVKVVTEVNIGGSKGFSSIIA